MAYRAVFLVLAVFWVTMNALLWRQEFGARRHGGAVVPVETVLRKILTAPDQSSLDIYHRGRKAGFSRWAVNVGEEVPATLLTRDDYLPEDLVGRVSHYTLDFEGSAELNAPSTRLGFSLHLQLGTNHAWQTLNLRFNLRPYVVSIRSEAERQTVRFQFDDGGPAWRETFRFDELEQPEKALRRVAGPFVGAMLPALGLPRLSSLRDGKVGLKWEARQDAIEFGKLQVRAYRLATPLWEGADVVVYVSLVGEILRAELPDGWVLVNDAFPMELRGRHD